MGVDTKWRFCKRCRSMFHMGEKGVCLGTPRGHTRRFLLIYSPKLVLFFDVNPYDAHSQGDWRRCTRCNVLFFNGNDAQNNNSCAAGGKHNPDLSRNYILKHNHPILEEWEEKNWRYCFKCHSLFNRGKNNIGYRAYCPGTPDKHHIYRGSGMYYIEKPRPYQKCFFVTSHNSYEEQHHLSIPEQLDVGVRGIEIDINDDDFDRLNYFQVGHYDAGRGCYWGHGNPNHPNDKFQDWLKVISDWSINKNGVHAPITIFIELKSYTHSEKKVTELENAIRTIPPNILFKSSEINKKLNVTGSKPWPSLQELWGRIIVVLTNFWGRFAGHGLPAPGYSNYEGFQSRWRYHLRNDCNSAFVAWTDEDNERIERNYGSDDKRAEIIQRESRFYICNNDKNLATRYFNEEPERLIRSDFGYTNPDGYLINFPISDAWSTALTSRMYKWTI